MKILSLITNVIESNSWPFNSVDKAETMELLKDLDNADAIEGVFSLYLSPDSDSDKKWILDEAKVSRFYAEYLLQTGSIFNLAEFESMWQQALPEGILTRKSHLSGLALIDEESNPAVIKYFSEKSLPEGVYDRLEILFEMKSKWTLEEIDPYVQALTTPKLNVNALLTKYARGSNINGIKYYSSKHGK